MKCKKIERQISAFAYGECPEESIQIVKEHLHECASCRNLLEEYSWLAEKSQDIAEIRIPEPIKDQLSSNVIQRLFPTKNVSKSSIQPRRSPSVRFALAGALIFLLFLGYYVTDYLSRPDYLISQQMSSTDLKNLSEKLTDDDFVQKYFDTPIPVSDLLILLRTVEKKSDFDRRADRAVAKVLKSLQESVLNDEQSIRSGMKTCTLTNYDLENSIECLSRIRSYQSQITLREISLYLSQKQEKKG